MSLRDYIEQQLNGPRDRLSIGAPVRFAPPLNTSASGNAVSISFVESLGLDEAIYLEKMEGLLIGGAAGQTISGLAVGLFSAGGGALIVPLATPVLTVTTLATGQAVTLLFEPVPLILIRDVARAAALLGIPLVQPLLLQMTLAWTGGGNTSLRLAVTWRRISGIQEG